jgi:SAM-dependent methyltransferase
MVAREFIKENNLTGRIDTYDADFNKDPFPKDADISIMASNLPMYGRKAIQAVIQKIHDALLPGGEFHLIGEALNEDRSGPADPAIWGLAQTLHNSTGMAHSVTECIGYLKTAGFQDVEVNDFVPEVLTRISGRKT